VAPAPALCNSLAMPVPATPASPSEVIDAIIEDLPDWRGEMLSRLRSLIKQAVPDVVEEIKWQKPSNPRGVPVWSRDGIICTGETYKDKSEAHVRQGGFRRRSRRPVQLQPRRQREASHRPT